MKPNLAALGLDAAMIGLFFLAIVVSSWWLFWAGLIAFLAALVLPHRHDAAQLLPPKPWGRILGIPLSLAAVGVVASLIGAALPGRGRGISIQGEGLAIVVVLAGTLAATTLGWWAVWRAQAADGPTWKRRVFWGLLATFLAALPVFALLETFVNDAKMVDIILRTCLMSMATCIGAAIALPHFDGFPARGAGAPLPARS